MLTFGMSVILAGLVNFRRGDRTLVVTTPPLLPFAVALASLAKGAGYTLLIHDNYPEILFAVGKSDPHSLFARTASIANRWLYKSAEKIIVVGRDMRELVAKKTEGLEIPIDVIPNWAELETVKPSPREDNQLLKDLGLEKKFVVLYAGNMGYPNDIETIVSAAELLREMSITTFCF